MKGDPGECRAKGGAEEGRRFGLEEEQGLAGLVGGARRRGRLPARDVDRGEVRRHQRHLHRVERAEGARVAACRLHTRGAERLRVRLRDRVGLGIGLG